MKEFVNILIKQGEKLLAQPYQEIKFTGNSKANELLNDIKTHPHAFVLACIMDRMIMAKRAWEIPYKISSEMGNFEFSKLLSLDLDRTKEIFTKKSLHRFNNIMAEKFYLALQRIHKRYNNDASNIWKGNPRSATIVRRFLQFQGVGIKIASMSTNILAREFKVLMEDKLCIDISPDVQVRRVFIRVGLIDENAKNDDLIYCARELNPKYPGIFDLPVWKIGKYLCRPKNPNCKECHLNSYCPKIGVN